MTAGAEVARLRGISAVSRNDVWAAGFYYVPGNALTGTLVEHWNGRRWSIVASADPSAPSGGFPGQRYLYGVSARGHSQAWAVGNYINAAAGRISTLTGRWNGRSWEWVKSPDSPRWNELAAVSADSRSDAWAVGWKNGMPDKALVEHWDGTAWHLVAFPDPGRDGKGRPNSSLSGVAALSPDDVWVCGQYQVKGGQVRTLLAHWNGIAWRQVATPASVKIMNTLVAISAPAPNDIWAVGGTTTIKGVQQAMALFRR
jgi:hypothetical protein